MSLDMYYLGKHTNPYCSLHTRNPSPLWPQHENPHQNTLTPHYYAPRDTIPQNSSDRWTH